MSIVFALGVVPRAARAEDGGPGSCTPNTCAIYGYNCGPNGDGCGGMLDCGVCTPPAVCGGGGFSICGDPPAPPDGGIVCVPETCQTLGFTCGIPGDHCGAPLNCGTCTAPAYCGGGGTNRCGSDAGASADASRSDAGAADAGSIEAPGAGVDASDAEAPSLDATLDSEAAGADAGVAPTSDGGCSCALTPESAPEGLAGIAWVLVAAAAAWKRRRGRA